MDKVLAPIEQHLVKFNQIIDEFLEQVPHDKIRKNYEIFFKARGKYLRPSLLMLSSGAVSGNDHRFDEGLYRLGLILELLHSASLVHDDIVDGDTMRRGEKTINQVFGNKIAVLAGDTLFSYAFREATLHYDKAYNIPITKLALDMCMAELEQANEVTDYEGYLRVIKGKTAEFMAVACSLGARYGGAEDEMIDLFYQFGLNIGLTYQMVDDVVDKDPNALKYLEEAHIDAQFKKTQLLLKRMPANIFTESLETMLNYIMAMRG